MIAVPRHAGDTPYRQFTATLAKDRCPHLRYVDQPKQLKGGHGDLGGSGPNRASEEAPELARITGV
jgi:hypothetical protein